MKRKSATIVYPDLDAFKIKITELEAQLSNARELIKDIFNECIQRDITQSADEAVDNIFNIVSSLCKIPPPTGGQV